MDQDFDGRSMNIIEKKVGIDQTIKMRDQATGLGQEVMSGQIMTSLTHKPQSMIVGSPIAKKEQ